jgi:hypothetical protein
LDLTGGFSRVSKINPQLITSVNLEKTEQFLFRGLIANVTGISLKGIFVVIIK